MISNEHSASSLPAQDNLIGRVLAAATSGERAALVRAWLENRPTAEQLQQALREVGKRDQGVAKLLRERLDEIRRERSQELIGAEWAAKAQALLDLARVNIADAMAWQRDAAKAGAALSREPLASLKAQLAERVRAIEDLQHRAQVQRETAVMLAQRIELLSTRSLSEAFAAREALAADVEPWQTQAAALLDAPHWTSVDARLPAQLEAARIQLQAVWDAFGAALAQARAAQDDTQAPLPAVPVWAEELRAARGVAAEAAHAAVAAPEPVDPQQRDAARQAVRLALTHLETELAEGHGKAAPKVAAELRHALKQGGRLIDEALDKAAHAALHAASELEGWQRWRADQLRAELAAKAEALVAHPLGGRKQQEALRSLREQWKQTDLGGAPNHALWRRFDEACNQAHKVVEAWFDKLKSETEAHKAQRLALIEEVRAWGAAHAASTDWKMQLRALHTFSERWRQAGHLGEKQYEQMLPQWKTAIAQAHAPLEAAQRASIAQREALIAEAAALAGQAMFRIDAVKALQQRWQAEALGVPLERRLEQKLWDAFRKPIDEAFARRSAERERAVSAVSEHDRRVLDASIALDAACASGDAQAIRNAMGALEQLLQGRAPGAAPVDEAAVVAAPAGESADAAAPASETAGDAAPEAVAAPAPAPAPTSTPAPARVVRAVRGDDRPGAGGTVVARPAPTGAAGRRDGGRGAERDGRAPGGTGGSGGRAGSGVRDAGERLRAGRGALQTDEREMRGPRLGDAAFRAQRDAFERAVGQLRKLASMAHGEALSALQTAWQQRDAALLPAARDLGRGLSPAQHQRWAAALSASAGDERAGALLRLEIAAEVPTPAEQLDARRALQLQLLTRRNDPSPQQTWAQDVADLLAGPFDAAAARRLLAALKVLLR